MGKADITNIFYGWKDGDWALCIHCGRVYQIGEFRLIHGLQYCPYPGCDGDTVMDAVHFHGIPERNKVYDFNSLPELETSQEVKSDDIFKYFEKG